MLYLVIYMAMTLGAFAWIMAMRRDGVMVEDIDSLAGLARTRPAAAFLFAAILFSLAGIPPLAGFFAKYYVFLAAIQAELYALAVIGMIATVVGAYYYLRIVKLMYFDEPTGELRAGARRTDGRACRLGRAHDRLPRHRRAAGARRRHGCGEPLLRMAFALGPSATAAGYRLAAYETIGSTSTEALERARQGDAGRLWIVARAQTAGHGRRGRPWATPSGNLAASLLLPSEQRRRARRHPGLRRRHRACAMPIATGLLRGAWRRKRAAAQMAERCAVRRREGRRHSPAGEHPRPGGRPASSSASESTLPRRRRACPIPPRRCMQRASRSAPKRFSRRWPNAG